MSQMVSGSWFHVLSSDVPKLWEPFWERLTLGNIRELRSWELTLPGWCLIKLSNQNSNHHVSVAVQKQNNFEIAMLTHKVLTHHQPGYLSELIVAYWPVYNLCLANNNLLIIPRIKAKIASRAFRVSAPTIWNSHSFSWRCMHNNHFLLP